MRMHAPDIASAERVVRDCRFAWRSGHLTDASFDAAVLLGNGGAGGGHSQIAWQMQQSHPGRTGASPFPSVACSDTGDSDG